MEKVVFFGTSDRSVPILESLKNNFDLVMCVTKDDVLVGRHQVAKETEVKRWARENGVNCITIKESLNKEYKEIIEHIKASRALIGVVADFGFIIPQQILNVFSRGMINVHFSLLPKYRGASPVQFAILNRDKETGITYQLMEYELDKGAVLKQLPYPLTGSETSGEIYQSLFKLSAQQLSDVLQDYLKEKLTPTPQDESKAIYTYSPSHPKNTHIYKEDAKIDWTRPADSIDASIRAYNPWPIAWTTLSDMQNARDKIVGFTQVKDHGHLPKTVKIYEAVISMDARIGIQKLQMEGGKVLTWEQFKNGYLTSS